MNRGQFFNTFQFYNQIFVYQQIQSITTFEGNTFVLNRKLHFFTERKPCCVNSKAKQFWYVDSSSPGPKCLWTSMAHPKTFLDNGSNSTFFLSVFFTTKDTKNHEVFLKCQSANSSVLHTYSYFHIQFSTFRRPNHSFYHQQNQECSRKYQNPLSFCIIQPP